MDLHLLHKAHTQEPDNQDQALVLVSLSRAVLIQPLPSLIL